MEHSPLWSKEDREFLARIQELSRKKKIRLYLVGGALRDAILEKNKDNPDFDFCLKKGAINFAREIAKDLKAGFFVLDPDHGCARLVKKDKGRVITLDFSDFRGKNIEEDTLLRDFTINSMAIGLEGIFSSGSFEEKLIDLYGGRNDLSKGSIRAVSIRSFDDDPLRIMRAFSLSAVFGFRIERGTLRMIDLKKKKLASVSQERIRDELFKILATPKAYEVFEQLDEHGILELVFPEVRLIKDKKNRVFRRMNVWAHTMLTLENTSSIIKNSSRNHRVRSYLDEEISSGRNRAALLKLAALLHDIGKPGTFSVEKKKVRFHGHERLGASMAGDIASRLKLSKDEAWFLKRAVFLHLRPGYMVANPAITARARFRFFRDAGAEAGTVLILALADERSTKGYLLLDKIRKRYERVIPRLLREYFADKNEPPARRLVDGNDIMDKFGLEPSPVIGRILKELEELQAIGKIKTKEEAFRACAGSIKKFRQSS
jgi:poly(A) polymerase